MSLFHMQYRQIHSFMWSMCKNFTYLSINGRLCHRVHTATFTQHFICLSSGDLPKVLFSRNLTPVLLNIYCLYSDSVTTFSHLINKCMQFLDKTLITGRWCKLTGLGILYVQLPLAFFSPFMSPGTHENKH